MNDDDPEPDTPKRAIRPRRSPRVAFVAAAVTTLVVLIVGVVVAGVLAADEAPGPLVARADPLLPDLAMGPITSVAVGSTPTGEQRLRFDASIVNVGEGPFMLRASRPWFGDDSWNVEQWFEERNGGYSKAETPAGLIFGGDGHDHWHVRQVEVHQLETLDGQVLGSLEKQGFCFFDTDAYRTSLPNALGKAHWGAVGCQGEFGNRVHMGLSVGWSDEYPWHLLDERIDVTLVPDGIYRIRQIADPNHEFEESDEDNNETWVDVRLTTNAEGLRETEVIEAGPAP
jgi:hypothetical protein